MSPVVRRVIAMSSPWSNCAGGPRSPTRQGTDTRSPEKSERVADVRDPHALVLLHDLGHLHPWRLRIQRFAATLVPPCPGGLQAGTRPFLDESSLKLRQGREEMEDQLA